MILDGLHATSDDEDFAGNVTLDALLRRLGRTRGERLALVDPSDRPVFTDGVPRRLSWSALDREVDRIARGLRMLGLPRDSVVAIQIPNTVESAIAILGTIRAGMIAAPLPLAWRRREISQALAQTGARAAIGVSRAGPVAVAANLCEAASEVFAVRFLLAFGRGVPDGVMAIDEEFGANADEAATAPALSGRAADHVAVITFDASPEGFVPLPRSHRQVVAAGLAHIIEAQIGATDVLATSLLPGGIAGLATGLVSALLAGVPLVLHQPFSSRVFAGSIVTEGVTHAVLPGKVAAALGEARRLPNDSLRGFSAVWRSGEEPAGAWEWGGERMVTDVTMFGELGFACARRMATEEPTPLPLGCTAPLGARPAGAATLLATRIGAESRLEVSGMMVPARSFPGPGAAEIAADREGWMQTGLGCAAIEPDALSLGAFREGVVQIGGVALPRANSLAVIEELEVSGAELTPDPLFGTRLTAPAGEDTRGAMAAGGVTTALFPGTPQRGRRRSEAAA